MFRGMDIICPKGPVHVGRCCVPFAKHGLPCEDLKSIGFVILVVFNFIVYSRIRTINIMCLYKFYV